MPRTADQQSFWDERFAQAWDQCLKEHGLSGAIGCAHLCRDAADAALAERVNSQQAKS